MTKLDIFGAIVAVAAYGSAIALFVFLLTGCQSADAIRGVADCAINSASCN